MRRRLNAQQADRPIVRHELSGEQRQRVDIEHLAELVLAQTEELHQTHRAVTLNASTTDPVLHDACPGGGGG